MARPHNPKTIGQRYRRNLLPSICMTSAISWRNEYDLSCDAIGTVSINPNVATSFAIKVRSRTFEDVKRAMPKNSSNPLKHLARFRCGVHVGKRVSVFITFFKWMDPLETSPLASKADETQLVLPKSPVVCPKQHPIPKRTKALSQYFSR